MGDSGILRGELALDMMLDNTGPSKKSRKSTSPRTETAPPPVLLPGESGVHDEDSSRPPATKPAAPPPVERSSAAPAILTSQTSQTSQPIGYRSSEPLAGALLPCEAMSIAIVDVRAPGAKVRVDTARRMGETVRRRLKSVPLAQRCIPLDKRKQRLRSCKTVRIFTEKNGPRGRLTAIAPNHPSHLYR